MRLTDACNSSVADQGPSSPYFFSIRQVSLRQPPEVDAGTLIPLCVLARAFDPAFQGKQVALIATAHDDNVNGVVEVLRHLVIATAHTPPSLAFILMGGRL